MSTTEIWTVGKLLTWTTDYLKKNGSSSPRLDAEVLLSHARGCQRIELYTAFDEEPNNETRTALRELVRRRSAGTPVAYLVGHREFYSASFEVTPDVLIPRPETEHLVVEALDRAEQLRRERGLESQRLQIADVGTGSGIVGITLAKHLPHCRITAMDISAAALQVARSNAQLHELDTGRIRFVEADLLSGCEPDLKFDLILSNPPYVSEAEYEQLDKSIREFEPKSALLAGPTGAELIVRLLEQSRAHLADDGYLLFEFSPMLAERLQEMLGSAWQLQSLTKDLAGHARIVTLKKRNP